MTEKTNCLEEKKAAKSRVEHLERELLLFACVFDFSFKHASKRLHVKNLPAGGFSLEKTLSTGKGEQCKTGNSCEN